MVVNTWQLPYKAVGILQAAAHIVAYDATDGMVLVRHWVAERIALFGRDTPDPSVSDWVVPDKGVLAIAQHAKNMGISDGAVVNGNALNLLTCETCDSLGDDCCDGACVQQGHFAIGDSQYRGGKQNSRGNGGNDNSGARRNANTTRNNCPFCESYACVDQSSCICKHDSKYFRPYQDLLQDGQICQDCVCLAQGQS